MEANYFTILYWFCHTSTWIHHGCTRVPHPEPPSHLPPQPSLWVIPVHQPRASCIMHRTWTGDSFHIWYYTCFNAILPNHPTLALSSRVQKTVLYICVSFAVSHTGLSLPSLLVQVRCTILDAWGWCTGTTEGYGVGREVGSEWGTHVYLWRIHFDIWQN